jgi:hypothetical protein
MADFTPKQLAIIVSSAFQQRFWSRVRRQEGDGCWLWIAGTVSSGYGAIVVGGRQAAAHRVSWVIANGPITDGLWVLHDCDARYSVDDTSYRACVRPSHLFLGTHRDNVVDAVKKGRSAFGDRNGTHLHPESVARGERQGWHTHPESRLRGDRNWTRQHPERLQRGGNSPLAVLTEQQVSDIRARHVYGSRKFGAKALAKEYGVWPSTVERIVRGETWKTL